MFAAVALWEKKRKSSRMKRRKKRKRIRKNNKACSIHVGSRQLGVPTTWRLWWLGGRWGGLKIGPESALAARGKEGFRSASCT